MSNRKVETTPTGFNVTPSQSELDRQARRKRMEERIKNPKSTYTNKEVIEAVNDVMAELLEQRNAK